jgi:hypothetical protein
LQKERAHPVLPHQRRKLRIGIPAPRHRAEVHRPHRVDHRLLGVAVGDGRDIGHDKAPNGPRVAKRQRHRRLAAHGMANDVSHAAMGRDHLSQIGGEVGIGVAVLPRAGPVVAHVDGQNAARVRQPLGQHAPVPRRAEKAMGDQERRLRGILAMDQGIEHGALSTRAIGDTQCTSWMNVPFNAPAG